MMKNSLSSQPVASNINQKHISDKHGNHTPKESNTPSCSPTERYDGIQQPFSLSDLYGANGWRPLTSAVIESSMWMILKLWVTPSQQHSELSILRFVLHSLWFIVSVIVYFVTTTFGIILRPIIESNIDINTEAERYIFMIYMSSFLALKGVFRPFPSLSSLLTPMIPGSLFVHHIIPPPYILLVKKESGRVEVMIRHLLYRSSSFKERLNLLRSDPASIITCMLLAMTIATFVYEMVIPSGYTLLPLLSIGLIYITIELDSTDHCPHILYDTLRASIRPVVVLGQVFNYALMGTDFIWKLFS
eukprot:gnl/Dysnectes_brevis/1118_a1249_3385.p1 GENE.gnl/Dysnectes_brevis/1118_a1249_3385~~gnl/Dysnectes_brevis/1118_a1249_3385.p1  ORF type:complete len:303 (+),score=-13.18 gnl/Dysnectes_brevis/1118_a1249_3385:210-1118(+)